MSSRSVPNGRPRLERQRKHQGHAQGLTHWIVSKRVGHRRLLDLFAGLPNKVLQLASADGRASRSLWRLQLNTDTLGGPERESLLDHASSEYWQPVLLPNADRAVVEDAKVRDYLLSPTHPVGRFKSVFFIALGFSSDHWLLLGDALLDLARTGDAAPGQPSPFRLKFEIHAIPLGLRVVRWAWLRSGWFQTARIFFISW
jgi:hypothetical protein